MNHPDTTTAHDASKSTIKLLTNSGRLFSLLLLLPLSALNLFWAIPLHAGRPTLPAAPSNLAATTVSSTQINLSWRDNSGNESGFTIERSISATGPWLQIASTAVNATSYSNSGLSAATTYYYRVYAYNSRGSSSYSSVASATTAQGSVPSCTYSISPASASFPSSGGNGSSSVATSSGCTWTATSGATWITITAGASGTGSGTTTFSVAANTSTSSRTGSLTIAGQTFTVSQAAAATAGPVNDFCANGIVISGSSATLPGANVAATKEAGEPNHAGFPGGRSVWWSWTAPSAGSVTINTFGSSFDTLLGVYTGTSVSALTIIANNDDSGGMQSSVTFNAVAGTTYQIAVDGYAAASGNVTLNLSQTTTACTYSVSPTSAYQDSLAGSGTATVTAGAGCSWTASSSATSWLTCTPVGGAGNGTVTWSATANTSTSSRAGTLTIAGRTFTVSQAGTPCTYSISSTSANPGAAASSGAVTVTAGAGCSWTASSSATSWLNCTPASGTGNGTVSWTATPNTSTSSRTGTLTIAGQTFTVTQAGVACTYAISSTSANPGAAASSGAVTVTAGAGCNWTASSSATSWLNCAPASGTGNGSVTWSATANTSTSSRTGTLTIAGQTFTVTQTGAACTFSIGGSSASFGSAGGPGSVNVTASGSTCTWTAGSSASWITINSGASGTGNGSVSYSVAANTATSSRTGNLTIAGQTFTVSEAGATPDSPPTASLNSPGNGATISGTATFGGTATDDYGVTRMEFWCDGAVLLGTATTAPYSVTYNTANIPNGTRTFTCKAYDTGGQAGTSTPITATVNNTTTTPGACIWAARVGTSFYLDGASARQSVVDASGNMVVLGNFQGTLNINDASGRPLTSAGQGDAFIAKYSASGTLLWAKNVGGVYGDAGRGLALDQSGNIVVVGNCRGTVDFGGGAVVAIATQDIFVAKYSSSGAYLWAKRFGSVNLSDQASGESVAIDASGNVIVGGYSTGSVNLGGGALAGSFVAKYSASGAYLWAIPSSWPGGLALDSTGNLLLTGADLITKYAGADGHLLWSKPFVGAGSTWGTGITVDASGNILVTGYFTGQVDFSGGTLTAAQLTTGAYQTVFMAKYSPAGDCQWAKKFGGQPAGDSGKGIASDSNGNIFLTGFCVGAIDFGGGYKFGSNQNMFIAKFSPAGGYQWAKRTGAIASNAVTVDANGNAIVSGYFGSTVDFGGLTLTSGPCNNDAFVVKYAP